MPRVKGEKKAIKIAPKRQKVKTRSTQKTKLKSNFDKCCKTIKENFDLVVSEGMLQITAVEPVQKFLENLADEIKLQIEIIEHRAIIQELRQKSLLSTPTNAKNGRGKAKAKTKASAGGVGATSRKAEKKVSAPLKKENNKSKKYTIDNEIGDASDHRGGDEEWMDDATNSQTLSSSSSSVKGKGKRRNSGAGLRGEKENPSLFDESAI